MDEPLTDDGREMVRYSEAAAAVVLAADADAVLEFRLRDGPGPCQRNVLEMMGLQRESATAGLTQSYLVDGVARDDLAGEVVQAWSQMGRTPQTRDAEESGGARAWVRIGDSGEVSILVARQEDGSVAVVISGTTGCARGPADLDRDRFWEQVDPDGEVVQRGGGS